jgi:SAM-dependent methyltransferase
MTEPEQHADGVDVERPSVARMYDFLLGGHHNFAGDRQLGRKLLSAAPNARYIVAENRAFLLRAVGYLADAGIRQFLDLGSGFPTSENVHQVARRHYAEARVVYVDNDPNAIADSRLMLADDRLATAIHADLRHPEKVLADPLLQDLLDFSEPVGLLMINVLSFVPDSDDPAGAVRGFADALAPGSHLVITHSTRDPAPETVMSMKAMYADATVEAQARTRDEIMRMFEGFDLVEPGLVYMQLWRPDGDAPEHPEQVWFYAGVGHKPAPA